MDQKTDKKGAAVRFPPPLVFLLAILLSFLLHRILPLSFPLGDWLSYLGGAILFASILLLANLFFAFRRAKTHIEPWKPTSHIITTGVYAYSRNPIYLAFCLITVGIALLVNSVWVFVSMFPSAYLIYLIAIKKEEAYLAAKFGQEYLDYKESVSRWLSLF